MSSDSASWLNTLRGNLGFVICLLLLICVGQIQPTGGNPIFAKETSELSKAEALYSSKEVDDEVDDYIDIMQRIIAGIIAFVIVVVVVCLFLCFCCPICIIAKLRQRRGVVVRTANGVTTTQSGNTVTVTVNRPAQQAVPATATVTGGPQVVAISNNLNSRNKPYPVQESVTVVPLLQPQMPVQYPPAPTMNMGYPQGPQFPQNFELPPPYPGLPRDPESANLPYNPYFTDESQMPSAPPPK